MAVEKGICVALGLPEPSTKCTQVQFSLGDLRTTSWLLQGVGVNRLAGSIHGSQFDTITVVSSEAFKRLKAAALASRMSNPVRQPPPQPPLGNQFRATYVQAVIVDPGPFSSTPAPHVPGPPTSPEGGGDYSKDADDQGAVEELLD